MSKPDEPIRFRNYYECSVCGARWEDEWSSACNDRCPDCDTEIEPYKSEDLDPVKEVSITIQINQGHASLLRHQKQDLVDALSKNLLPDRAHGIVSLLDAIQDQLVDGGHFPEDVVFDL